MNILPKAAHRPSRRFPDAPRKLLQPEVKECPYCGYKLKSTGNLNINREVQTMNGPLNVRAYSWHCVSDDCPRTDIRYRARRELWRISLPKCGYGLDVIAHIGWQHDKIFRQFGEIQLDLQSRGIQISERHVGRLYRQYLSLLGGMTVSRLQELKKINHLHGGIVLALDGLQPDKDGTQLYVLYEAISETTIAAAWIDKRDTEHLTNWLKPYSKLELTVLGTLSDGEDAEIAALKGLWKNSPHQMCLTNFLGDCAKPIKEADQKLKGILRQGMGKLPPVPGDENSAKAGPTAATPVLSEPTTLHHTIDTLDTCNSEDETTNHDDTTNNSNTSPINCSPDTTDTGLPAPSQASCTNQPAYIPQEQNTFPNQNESVEEAQNDVLPQLPTSRGTEPQIDEALFLPSGLSENKQANRSSQYSTDSPIIGQIPCANAEKQIDCKPKEPIPSANASEQMEDELLRARALGKQSDLASSLSMANLVVKEKTDRKSLKTKLSFDHIQTFPKMGPLIDGNDRTKTSTFNQFNKSNQKIEIEQSLSTLESDQSVAEADEATGNTGNQQRQSILSAYETISTSQTTSGPETTSTTEQPAFEQPANQKQLRMREIELLFRKSFQQALNQPSRYPSCFGGWIGYQQLSSIIQAMQDSLEGQEKSYLHRLYTCGQQALNQAAELALQVSQSIDLLTELTSILFEPFSDSSQEANANKKSSDDVKKEAEDFIDSVSQEDQLAQSFIN